MLAILADEYYEDLADDFSEELFAAAERIIRKTCTYFPQVADLYRVRDDAINSMGRAKEERRLALPEVTGNLTPEEEFRNEERLNIVRRAIAGEISYLEAAEELEKMIGFSVDWPGRKSKEAEKE